MIRRFLLAIALAWAMIAVAGGRSEYTDNYPERDSDQ